MKCNRPHTVFEKIANLTLYFLEHRNIIVALDTACLIVKIQIYSCSNYVDLSTPTYPLLLLFWSYNVFSICSSEVCRTSKVGLSAGSCFMQSIIMSYNAGKHSAGLSKKISCESQREPVQRCDPTVAPVHTFPFVFLLPREQLSVPLS